MAEETTVPQYEFSGFYYFDILRNLLQYTRLNVPEITDESDEEPFIQLIRAWALAHHHSNVLLDVVANETLLPTARLLESVRSQLKLIDFELSQATAATTDVVLQFSALFTAASTEIVPINSQFSTEATDDVDAVVFEATTSNTISATNALTFIFGNESVPVTLSAKVGNQFDIDVEPNVGDIIYQGGTYVIVTEVVDTDTIKVNDESIVIGAATLLTDSFGSNKVGEATSDGPTFTFNTTDPDVGDILYLIHDSVMWDQIDIKVTQAYKTGITGVWEFFDNDSEDENPDDVDNTGSNLEFDLTTMLGTTDRSGTKIKVTAVQNSATEEVMSIFTGGVNKVTTSLLGQTSPSEKETDYLVGSVWNPLTVTDGTDDSGPFSKDGSVTFDLPQTLKNNWQSGTVNNEAGFSLRFRTQALTKTAATFTGTDIEVDDLDTSHYNVVLEIDGFSATTVDVTGDAGVGGVYTPESVRDEINTAMGAVDLSLASVASVVGGEIKITAPDDALGKDSQIVISAPGANNAVLEVFGLTSGSLPLTTLGIGGLPVFDRVDIDGGAQFLKVAVVQGESQIEDPLGSSDGSPSQEFILGFAPLIDGTLTISVDEGSGFTDYDEVSNFLTATQASKNYTLEIDADDVATVQFGDGVNGKIPPAGADNIRATYRIGADVDGNVGSSTIIVNTAGISFVNRVFNPRAATGYETKDGSTLESLEKAKIEGPASLRALGRALTADDIETLAVTFEDETAGGTIVSRALAIEETFGIKTIELVVVGNGGVLLSQEQREDIQNFFNGSKTEGIDGVLVSNHEVTVVNYTQLPVDVTATVTGGTLATIETALTSLLNPEAKFDDNVTPRWAFGDEIPPSIISAEIHETDVINVRKVDLTVPAAPITLSTRELPVVGTLTITVV